MEISISGNNVIIQGDIKSVGDYQTIKSNIDALSAKETKFTIKIPDSISITSSIIGYFNKLVLKDKRDIDMLIGSDQLMELLQDLNLDTLFKAKKL